MPPRAGSAAGRRPTLQDVAERAGVSRALVSIVVRGAPGASEATRVRVLAVAEELGYRPDVHARLLARHHTQLLGVTVSLGHPFHADVVSGLYEAAERHGYDLVLSATTPTRDHHRAVESLLEYRAEGVVLLAPEMPEAALSAFARRVPVVVVARRVRDREVRVVRTAEETGVRQAVGHLVSLGHRAIAHVDGGGSAGAADRRRGYRAAMRRHRLPERVITGGQSEEDGARGAREVLSGDPVTAVVCYNDRSAVGLLDVLIRAGLRVPDDVSVVGFDDSQLARLSHINLTTVAQDVTRMADLAVAGLVHVLDPPGVGGVEGAPVRVARHAGLHQSGGELQPAIMPEPQGWTGREMILPPRLVVRGSTAAARR
jgi:DNA-binding LacI/PurR family transcriptional regulator